MALSLDERWEYTTGAHYTCRVRGLAAQGHRAGVNGPREGLWCGRWNGERRRSGVGGCVRRGGEQVLAARGPGRSGAKRR